MSMEHLWRSIWQEKPKCANEFVPVQIFFTKFLDGLSWDWRREFLRKFRRHNTPRLRRGRTIRSDIWIYNLRFSMLYLTNLHYFPFLRNQWKVHKRFHASYRGYWLSRVSLRLHKNVTVFWDILRSFLRAVQIIFHRNLERDIVFYFLKYFFIPDTILSSSLSTLEFVCLWELKALLVPDVGSSFVACFFSFSVSEHAFIWQFSDFLFVRLRSSIRKERQCTYNVTLRHVV